MNGAPRSADGASSTAEAAPSTSGVTPDTGTAMHAVAAAAVPSPMAAAPRPASHSSTAKRADECIRGGGGLAPRSERVPMRDRVMSRTRPRNLPPKPRDEDAKHWREHERLIETRTALGKFAPPALHPPADRQNCAILAA